MADPTAKKPIKYLFLTTGHPTLKMESPYGCVMGKEDVYVRTIEFLYDVTSCIPEDLSYFRGFTG
jgi:hypothetical protein